MRLIRQPRGSSLCGHCVVAMAAGVSLKRVIEVVGHERATRTKELVKALREFGVAVRSDRRVRFTDAAALPRRCVLYLKLQGKTRAWGHYVLRWDGRDYDPGNRGLIYWANRDPRLTSYLEIG
jgi:hypothetical protein